MKSEVEILESVNDALGQVMEKGTDEARLLGTMSRLPGKYNFGDNDVYLEISVQLHWGEEGEEKEGNIKISRSRGHSFSEPFWFRFCQEGEEDKNLKYENGRWVFGEID